MALKELKMKNRTTVAFLVMGILAGSLLSSCDTSTVGQNELEQELRFFNIFRQANYPDAVHQASGIYFQENREGTGAAPGDSSWLYINHVAYTIPEKKVFETYIESEISRLNLQDYITQVIIPTEKVYQVRNGKKISRERNYFPGYVFVEAILVGEIPHILKNIPNVISFLSETKGGDPVPLRPSEVNRMLGKVDELKIFHFRIYL